MNETMRRELELLGVVFEKEEPPAISAELLDHRRRMAKGYYDDPRDPVTKEIPF